MVFIGVFAVVWILGLTAWVFWTVKRIKRITGARELQELTDTQKTLLGRVNDLYKTLDDVRGDGRFHIQRVGLVRFNPFSDTGGSQSFTLSLLDGYDNGLVMTSLYARNGHRWYIKEVVAGKGKELLLSKEEKDAVAKAKPFEGIKHE